MMSYIAEDGKTVLVGHSLHEPETSEILGIGIYHPDKHGPPNKPLYFHSISEEEKSVFNCTPSRGTKVAMDNLVGKVDTVSSETLKEIIAGREFEVPDLEWSTLKIPEDYM